MRTHILLLLVSIISTQKVAKNAKIVKEDKDQAVIDLTVNVLNRYFKRVKMGTPFNMKRDDIGNAKITLTKPKENLLKVFVEIDDPKALPGQKNIR